MYLFGYGATEIWVKLVILELSWPGCFAALLILWWFDFNFWLFELGLLIWLFRDFDNFVTFVFWVGLVVVV